MGIKVSGSSGINAEVDANKSLQVTGPLVKEQAGFQTLGIEKDPGTILGTRFFGQPDVSRNRRMRVGVDTLLFDDTFNAQLQNFGNWKYSNSTMVVAWSAGYMTLNVGASVAASTGALVQTYRTFPLTGAAGLMGRFTGYWAVAPQAGNIVEFGFGFVGSVAPFAVTDGCFFRLDTAGTLHGVISYNGSEAVSSALPLTNVQQGVSHLFRIVVDSESVGFWIDGVLYANINTDPAYGQPCMSASLPLFFKCYNPNLTTLAQQLKISDVTVQMADFHTSKPWSHQMAGAGFFAMQTQNGHTNLPVSGVGCTAYLPMSVVPLSVLTPTATAMTGPSGLGGLFMTPASALTVGTDYNIMGYQNPAPTSIITGRVLYITGIGLDTLLNSLAAGSVLSLGGYVMHYALNTGGTSVTLNLTDGSAIKAYRRYGLGFQTFPSGAIIGQVGAPTIFKTIDPPLPVYPGEWAVVSMKPLNYTTQQGSIWHNIAINGYWE